MTSPADDVTFEMQGPIDYSSYGPDQSREYAKGVSAYDRSLIDLASPIAKLVQTGVLAPSVGSVFHTLFGLNLKADWSFFEAPFESLHRLGAIFHSQQLLPSLGPDHFLERHLEHLHQKLTAIIPPKDRNDWQEMGNYRKGQEEGHALVRMLQEVQEADKTLATIFGRMGQYQRG